MRAIFTTRNILALLLFTPFMHSHAAIYMTKPYSVTVDSDQYLEFGVKCDDDEELLKARKLESEAKTQWCAADLPSLCTTRRTPLARKMCLPNFERKVASYRKSQPDADLPIEASDVPTTTTVGADETLATESSVQDSEALLNERNEIEEKKIQLQNRKMELERMKRELEKLE